MDDVRPEQLVSEAHRIAADVPDRAAADRGIRPGIVGTVEEERERAVDQPQLAEVAAVRELQRTPDLRVVQVHERLDRDPLGVRGDARDRVDVFGPERKRLLAQDVLARLERADRPRHVQVIRQRDVDDVDIRIRHERVVRVIDPFRAVGRRERLRPCPVA